MLRKYENLDFFCNIEYVDKHNFPIGLFQNREAGELHSTLHLKKSPALEWLELIIYFHRFVSAVMFYKCVL